MPKTRQIAKSDGRDQGTGQDHRDENQPIGRIDARDPFDRVAIGLLRGTKIPTMDIEHQESRQGEEELNTRIAHIRYRMQRFARFRIKPLWQDEDIKVIEDDHERSDGAPALE